MANYNATATRGAQVGCAPHSTGDRTMRYAMMQIMRDMDGSGSYTCHVTIRDDDTRQPPIMRHYRNVTPSSVCRFFDLSGGYFTAYSQRTARETGR